VDFIERMSLWNAESRNPFHLLAEIQAPGVREHREQQPPRSLIALPCFSSDDVSGPSQDSYILHPIGGRELIVANPLTARRSPNCCRVALVVVGRSDLDPDFLPGPLVPTKYIGFGWLAQTVHSKRPSRRPVVARQELLDDTLFCLRFAARVFSASQWLSLTILPAEARSAPTFAARSACPSPSRRTPTSSSSALCRSTEVHTDRADETTSDQDHTRYARLAQATAETTYIPIPAHTRTAAAIGNEPAC